MNLIRGISESSAAQEPFRFFMPKEGHCFAISISSPLRSCEHKKRKNPLSGRVHLLGIPPVHSAKMQADLDLALEIIWKKEIGPKMLFQYDEPRPTLAKEIRCWLQDPCHSWRLNRVKNLHLRSCGLTVFPPEMSYFAHLEILDLSDNPSIHFFESWTAEFKQLKTLNLSGCRLPHFPSGITELSSLELLNFSSNELTDLPVEIAELSQLKHLCLYRNPFDHLSESFGLLTALNHLEHLDLSNCRLSSLPPTIGCFSHLEVLDISMNELNALPDELGKLERLKALHLYQNRLKSFPPILGNLAQLELLELSDNQIMEISGEIGQLERLSCLQLSDNALVNLPKEIGQLSSLQILNVARNQLVKLPEEIAFLTHLHSLNVSGNRLTGIPEKVLIQIKRDPDFNFSLHSNPMLFLSRQLDLGAFAFSEDVDHEEMLTKYQACSIYSCRSPLAILCQEIHRGSDANVLLELCKGLSSYMKDRVEAILKEISWSDFLEKDLLSEAVVMAVQEKFQKLSSEQRLLVYNTIWKLAGSPKVSSFQWGALHAEKNIIRLIDAMELHLELGLP